MGLFKTAPRPMARTLRVLARLLAYPDAELRAHLPVLRAAVREEAVLGAARTAEIEALMAQLARQDALDAEADYVQLFDSGRRTALHLFEHVHGDSRERGPALIDLAQTYERAGLFLAPGQMPDHLPVALEFASTQPPREAAAFLGEIAHLVNVIFAALAQRESRYASVMGALLDLAGVPARAVELPAEEPIDALWEEPPAFDGCSSATHAAGGAPRKGVHVTRRADAPAPPPPASSNAAHGALQ
ncbi:MAG: nitrate reductase molybdenum cofactor assembly chaperone [Rubrivivax sp. SCN 71-131]|jgi:nitrate reductase delta subunit|nr:MAG: nitrate reductase molybdenum cofactor assembly chaperone [Rubrivivax sp. SCN 71-131]